MHHALAELEPLLAELSFDGPLEPFGVLADWLQTRGDPWGEVIALACAVERGEPVREAYDAALAAHGAGICAAYARDPNTMVWQRGFIRSVFVVRTITAPALDALLADVLASRASKLLLGVSILVTLDDAHAAALLRHAGRLHSLKSLGLTDNRFSPAVRDQLRAGFPAVDQHSAPLRVAARPDEAGAIALTRLETRPATWGPGVADDWD